MNRKETELFMAEKGLSYCAWNKHEASQVLTVAGDAGENTSVVFARVTQDGKDTFHWGFYPNADALVVAKSINRLRKVPVTNVTIIHSSTRI